MKGNRTNYRQCQVCRHEERWRIELLKAGGASLDSLAAKFGVHRDAIWRHWRDHVPPEARATYLAGPADMEKLVSRAADEGESVLDFLKISRNSLVSQLAALNEAGDHRNAAFVADKLTRTCEVIARVTGELGDLARSVVNNNNNLVFINSPVFADLQAMLVRQLQSHPEALARVVEGLRELEARATPTSAPLIDARPLEATHV